MITPDLAFTLTSGLAAVGWITLFFLSPYWKGWDKAVIGVVVALLALAYATFNFRNFNFNDFKNFSSLKGVEVIFQNRELLTAAWIHIMAMDLVMATWAKKNSVRHGIKHLAVLPSLVFSLVLGPLGFLIYLLTRWIKTGRYFAENEM